MILKGMLKWAVGKDDHPINSTTKSLKKRRKVQQIDMHRVDASVGLIGGCCKHRNNNPQGQSQLLHKNRHRVGGVINNHKLNNDPDNNSPTCMDKSNKYKDEESEHFSKIPHKNNNNNSIINADSKSLFYMSLDHLPMAIVKQYERMLQDAPLKPPPQSILKSKTTTNCTTNSHRPSSIRIKNQKQLTVPPCKPPHSKSVTLHVDGSQKLTTKHNSFSSGLETKTTSSPCFNNTNAPKINIKEAHNRPLKVLSSSTTLTNPQCDRKNKTPSPKAFNEKPHNIVYSSNNNNSTKVPDQPKKPQNNSNTPTRIPPPPFCCDDTSAISLPTLNLLTPAAEKTINTTSVQGDKENDPDIFQKKISTDFPPSTTMINANKTESLPITRNNGKGNPHDTTDPQFLEKSITYSTPPISKCAKKLTLKRSELKKLERLKTQTERLNRFLKKYYHDCLPNLPEEEEEQCSPEEKSVCLTILRKHWREVKSSHQTHSYGYSYRGTNVDLDTEKNHSLFNEVHKTPQNRHSYSKELNNNSRFSPLLSSSFNLNSSGLSTNPEDCDPVIRWQNLRNATAALISYSNDVVSLPIIQEDSGEVSSSNSSEYHNQPQTEVPRESHKNILGFEESFLMSSTTINADDSVVQLTKESLGKLTREQRDNMSDNVYTKILYDDDDDDDEDCTELVEEEDGFGMKKLKGLMLEPLGDFFDPPASLAEDEGFMSPYPPEAYSPASSFSTFNRFSVSSSGKGSGSTEDEEHENLQQDDYDKDEISNLRHTQSQCSSSTEADQVTSTEEGGPEYIIMKMKHENANYLLTEENSNNETWNSHGYLPNSPCGIISLNSHHYSDSSSYIPAAEEDEFWTENKHVNDKDENEERFNGNRFAMAFSTPVSRSNYLPHTSLRSYRLNLKKSTPKKLVKKPPVNSTFSTKGEVLIRTYKNGDYVTVHVVQARRLQPHYRTSWKLSIKVSLLPEAETTFTRSLESILVGKNRSWVKIDQKFSFEIPATEPEGKVFLTFVKRLEKRTLFLGWATLDLSTKENTQCWLKLRKRKMSTATYPPQSSASHCHSSFMLSGIASPGDRGATTSSRHGKIQMDSPSPVPVHVEGGSSSSRCDCEIEIEPKSQLQNSSTMDSGVEDCCAEREPPPPPPPVSSIDLDDKVGQRVNVKLIKQEGSGFGFSVVWVSPPRIERLEKGKTADVAGLRIGDLIIGVNGVDVTTVPNTTIYTKMKTTGNEIELEVWRKCPQAQPRTSSLPASNEITPSSKSSSAVTAIESVSTMIPNGNEGRQNRETQQSPCAACLPQNIKNSSTSTNKPAPVTNRIQSQPPPISILKPPPPAPPVLINHNPPQSQQPSTGSSTWRIRFNIELLDNEDDCLKQFFICELKFFRKIVAALDRYLIPAQANRLLTPQEINLMFSNVIKIITVTKRILNCVANGSSSDADWKLGRILLSTHSDHLSEVVSAYSSYAKTLGLSAMILSDKMSLQEFARFVLETPVPKGHLDMTSLLFAPFEHLRNICEICEEVSHNNEEWLDLSLHLKECYADIVCETDFMEPISHISMKKNPLLSVRDLEKRIVSTSCQPLKVCEKGRKWLFGSRLFKKESDGSWTPVWAFLFSDIIVLTSHTTRDRVFFVKEPSIRLEDVVTLHFNLPRKHENEFRLLFGPEPVHQSRFDKILPIHRNKKSNQIILRTSNIQLKSVWKLLLQRQIITLNTRLSKSASSNFSISEFCERFPITPHDEDEKNTKLHQVTKDRQQPIMLPNGKTNGLQVGSTKVLGTALPQNTIFDRQHYSDERNLSVIKEEKTYSQSMKCQKPYAPDGLSSITKELLKSRVTRISPDRRNRVEVIHEEIKVALKPTNDPSDTIKTQIVKQESQSIISSVKNNSLKTSKIDEVVNLKNTATGGSSNKFEAESKEILHKGNNGLINVGKERSEDQTHVRTVPARASPSIQTTNPISSILNNNNNEIFDYNLRDKDSKNKCPCEVIPEDKPTSSSSSSCETDTNAIRKASTNRENKKDFLKEKIFYENAPHYSPTSSKHLVDTKPTIISKGTVLADSKDCNELRRNTKASHETLVEDNELHQTEAAPLSLSRQVEQHVLKEKFQMNNTPSPSMSNHRVEALKHEGVSLMKSKPGSRIMTNSTLKSRQQEILAQRNGETMITMVDKTDTHAITSTGNVLTGTDCILISQHIETIPVRHKDASSSPILNHPRCQSENSHLKAKSIHTDSPIISGFGSDRSRRRILYDYKIQRDYPELFGITPKDRRTFIKRLAEKQPDNDKSFIAPYYFSPLPTPKFMQRSEPLPVAVEEFKDRRVIADTYVKIESKKQVKANTQQVNECINVSETACSSKLVKTDNEEIIRDFVEGDDDDVDEIQNIKANDDINLKEVVRGILRGELDEDSDDDSDGSDGHDEARPQVNRHRSPEESSNDSGISDELTEKSKATNGFVGERFQCNMAVNSSEVNTVKFSPKLNNTIDKMPKKAHACNTTPKQYNKIDDVYFVEGEEEASMEEMVVLKKADKSTGTDDDYFNPCSWINRPEKSMRTLMAERREAFFASYQSASSFMSSGPAIPVSDPPLIVKIVDGGTRHSTIPDYKPVPKSPPSERVQLTRLPEKERTARVERVESSDDSTSSDLASASPALENGTTDPSWSSSSSSLAGYASSKEEASTSAGATAAAYNNNSGEFSSLSNSQSLASTSSRNNIKMSELSNGLSAPNLLSTFSNGSLLVTNSASKSPEIIVTQESPETPTVKNGYSSDGEEEDSVLCNGRKDPNNSESDSEKKTFLRVESNESTVENYGDEDDYNFDEEDDLSQCSIATINRYGTYESLEKIESDDNVGGLPDFSRPMTRSKARFTFEDEDSDDDNDLFEEDFESDFNFRFPSQIQDNTYSVSRLGPLPPLLEEDFEDDIYDEQRMNGASPSDSSTGISAHSSTTNTLRSRRHETGLRNDNSFLLARLATMYARSSISPLKILRELWLKKRYRQNWAYKE